MGVIHDAMTTATHMRLTLFNSDDEEVGTLDLVGVRGDPVQVELSNVMPDLPLLRDDEANVAADSPLRFTISGRASSLNMFH